MTMPIRYVALALVALVLVGCASAGAPKIDPITVTAETAASVADRAVRTNALYKQFCPTGQIDAASCEKWAAFYPEFKEKYALAYLAYKQAIASGDTTSAQSLVTALEAVSDQLLMFYLAAQKGGK